MFQITEADRLKKVAISPLPSLLASSAKEFFRLTAT
jgi:hypothetical protein